MNRTVGFAILLGLTLAASVGAAKAQSYGPIDTSPGGVSGGLGGADLPDSRARPPTYGNRAPSGYEATQTQCFKDGKEVDRAYCEADSFYRPNQPPGLGLYSQRCSNANTNYNPLTNSYVGVDGVMHNCQ